MGLAISHASAVEYTEAPELPGTGFPDLTSAYASNFAAWLGPPSRALTYAPKSRQWVRTPSLQAAAFNQPTRQYSDATCTRIADKYGWSSYRKYRGHVVLVNSEVAQQTAERYGLSRSIVIRSLAFGVIPVEAVIRLEQPRASNGVIVPGLAEQGAGMPCDNQSEWPLYTTIDHGDATLPIVLRVERVDVDGVRLMLSGECRTAQFEFQGRGEGFQTSSPEYADEILPALPGEGPETVLDTRFWNFGKGGLIKGAMDIPPFSGCVTESGDDLSDVLTAAISGPNNSVEIRLRGLEGSSDGIAGCPFVGDCSNPIPEMAIPTTPPRS
jgi:hypothetical protein